MKIKISNFYIKFHSCNIPNTNHDVIFLAGDIHVKEKASNRDLRNFLSREALESNKIQKLAQRRIPTEPHEDTDLIWAIASASIAWNDLAKVKGGIINQSSLDATWGASSIINTN